MTQAGIPSRAGVQSSFVELRHASTDRTIFVAVPARRLLAIDGIGEQHADDFVFATALLADVDRRLASRIRQDRFSLPVKRVYEALWWPPAGIRAVDVPSRFVDRSDWRWRQMLEVPGRASDEEIMAAIEEAHRAGGRSEALVRCISLAEGVVAQILHVGGHLAAASTVARLFRGIAEAERRPIGSLHILQLADPDHVPAGRGRLIIRQPVI